MQLQGLMLLIFILVAIPIMILSTNHNIFFIIIAFILLISSIKNLYSHVFNRNYDEDEPDEELAEELEDIMNLNMKKFGTGINVVKSLFILLFLAYCALYLNSLLLKAAAALAILLQVHKLAGSIKEENNTPKTAKIHTVLLLISNVLTIIIIAFTACNKFTGINF